MSEELKLCPFCGGKARMLGGPMAQERYGVWCENRHHITGGMDADALALEWNTRHTPKGYVLVPIEPTELMIEAAEDAYMPFGDMALALQVAINSAQESE